MKSEFNTSEYNTFGWIYEMDTAMLRDCQHTHLKEYLDVIFPKKVFLQNQMISENELSDDVDFKRNIASFMCKELKLVIELNTPEHYKSVPRILADMYKDDYFRKAGYEVVRIPFFTHLSNDAVKSIFGIDVDQKLCTFKYVFYNPNSKNSVNWRYVPGSMCELGRLRFIENFNSMTPEVRTAIFHDIYTCIKTFANPTLTPSILPYDMFRKMNVDCVIKNNVVEYVFVKDQYSSVR